MTDSLTVYSGLTFNAERDPMPDILTVFGGVTFDAEREAASLVPLFPSPAFAVAVDKKNALAKFALTFPAHKASTVVRPTRVFAALFLAGATIPSDGNEALAASVLNASVEVPAADLNLGDEQPELTLDVIVPISGLFQPGVNVVPGVQMTSVIAHPTA